MKLAAADVLNELKSSCSVNKGFHWAGGRHARAATGGYDWNSNLVTAIIKLYAKCGSMASARRMFDSIKQPSQSSWNSLLLGYAVNGEGQTCLNLFQTLKAAGKYAPDSYTYAAVLRACTSLSLQNEGNKQEALKQGEQIHAEISCSHLDLYVQNTLIDMYAKCGSMLSAKRVFDEAKYPDVVSWTALLYGYVENGEGRIALELFDRMRTSNVCSPNAVTYVSALKACACLAASGDKQTALKRGREIHAEAGCSHLDFCLQNTLIDMYSKCGSMAEAKQVFDSLQRPDVVSWTALLRGCAENGEDMAALELFHRMKSRAGCEPDAISYVAVVRVCTSLALNGEREEALRYGREIHNEAARKRFNDLCVHNTLIDMYSKCGSMAEAQRTFDSIRDPSVISWTALMFGYAENGAGRIALDLFSRMKEKSECAPNAVTYVAALKACATLAASGEKEEALRRGKEIHSEAVCLKGDVLYVENTLVDMYASCGSMAEAKRVFDASQNPDVVSWNALLMGYAENGEGDVTLELFNKMKGVVTPNSVTYIAVLKACSLIGALALGRKLHSEMEELNPYLVSCLVDFYAKCGSVAEARDVYDLHPRARGLSATNALLAGHSRFGDTVLVFNLFDALQDAGYQPDGVTFLCVLVCCSHAGLVEKARCYLEAMPLRYGVPPEVLHYSCVVDALGRANKLEDAVAVVRSMPCKASLVTWMTLLGACRKWRNVEVARWAFQCLLSLDRKHPPAYVLMAHIYGSSSMKQERESVLELGARTCGCEEHDERSGCSAVQSC